jgi:hypothetical protein
VRDLTLAPGNYVAVLPIHEGHSYLYRNVVAKFRVTGGGEMFWGLAISPTSTRTPIATYINGPQASPLA